MELCQHPDCQSRAENICLCNSQIFCSPHTLDHIKLSNLNHKIEDLFLPVPPLNKNLLISHLQSLILHLNTIQKETELQGKNLIKRILESISETTSNIQNLRQKLALKLSSVYQSGKTSKLSTDKLDQMLLKDKTELESYLNSIVLPEVKFSIPEDIFFSLTNNEFLYTAEDLTLSLIVSKLGSVNNKLQLFEYAKQLNDKDSQNSLLKIMKMQGQRNDLFQISSKAFTVLSKHHFNFSFMTFKNVNLSNSEVTGGKFYNTSFSNCNFTGAKLNQSVLLSATMDFSTYKTIQEGKKVLKCHLDQINAMKFTRDGHYLLSSASDGLIIIWDIASGHTSNVIQGHVGPVMCLDVSDDNTEILSGGHDGVVRLWDFFSGLCLGIFNVKEGEKAAVVRAVVLTSNKQFIIAGTLDQLVVIWNKQCEKISEINLEADVWTVQAPLNPIDDRNYEFFAGCRNGDLVLLSTNNKNVVWKMKGAHKQWISVVLVSSNGTHVVTAGSDGYIRTWIRHKHKVNFISRSTAYNKRSEIQVFNSGIYVLKAFSGFKYLLTVCEDQVKLIDRKKLTETFSAKLNYNTFVADISDYATYIAIADRTDIKLNLFPHLFNRLNN